MDMQHGQEVWTCNITCSREMNTPYSRPLPFSLPSGDLGSETGFPVWFNKEREKREFALFLRWVLSLYLALLRPFLLRGREHERAKKSGVHL
jgi:hypothetical protein